MCPRDLRNLVGGVQGNGPSLLGRDWLAKIRLDWPSMNKVTASSALKDVLKEARSALFSKELGKLKGVKVSLYIKPDAQPKFCKARSVPFLLKDKIEKELTRLQETGVVEPVQFSNRAAPVVPVLKSDNTVRICGDYKTTVNSVSLTESYPLPKIEELFTKLSGVQYFLKLDLSHALAPESLWSSIPTRNFCYNRLLFGIASAPAIFQRVMESLLQGMPGVAIYIDDILVAGKDVEDHLKKLEQVLKKLEEAGLKLKREKCEFLARSVEYLGYRISGQGLHPTEKR